jgi:hypothetical protein
MLLALFSQTMEKIVWEKIHDKKKKKEKKCSVWCQGNS